MIQGLLLGVLILLCVLLIISLIRKPYDERTKNPCKFKISTPRFKIDGDKKYAGFHILVEKKHKYFINFPLLFKFYSDSNFKMDCRIYYTTPGEDRQLVLDRQIEFISKTKEHTVYITDVIMGKILIEIELEVDRGLPIIEFEILENSTCTLMKEYKLEIVFPE